MNKYEVIYYHHSGCCYNRFFVEAKDEDDAKRIFGILYPVDWIEEVYDYDEEPRFWTEEEILKLKNKL